MERSGSIANRICRRQASMAVAGHVERRKIAKIARPLESDPDEPAGSRKPRKPLADDAALQKRPIRRIWKILKDPPSLLAFFLRV